MATRTVVVRSYIGPGADAPNAFVDVSPAYRFVDGVALNWPDPKTFRIESGVVSIDEVEDTYGSDWLVWEFVFRNLDSRNQPIGPSRRELVTFEGTTGTPVEYVDMHQVESYVPPEYMPPIYQQTVAARDETFAARDEAEAFGGTNNAQVAAMVTTDGPTKSALENTFVTFLNHDGTPVTGKHVIITLTPDQTDIEDIKVVAL